MEKSFLNPEYKKKKRKRNKPSKQDHEKAAAYRTEGSWPNTMGIRNYLKLLPRTQNNKVSTNLMEPHQLNQAFQGNHGDAQTRHVKGDTLAILEHFDHHHACHMSLQNKKV